MTKTANMMKLIVGGVWRLGRGTATVMGLAVILALAVGATSTALAGTGVGARFDLGKTNAVNQISKLVGSVAGPSLTVDNNSAAPGATALRLEVEPGKPPMSVNSTTEVQGLNVDSLDSKNSSEFLLDDQTAADADRLDGKDSTAFLPAETYLDTADAVTGKGAGTVLVFIAAPCDPGDKILNAGGGANPEDDMIEERPTGGASWLVRIRDNGAPTTSTVVANCIDFPPTR